MRMLMMDMTRKMTVVILAGAVQLAAISFALAQAGDYRVAVDETLDSIQNSLGTEPANTALANAEVPFPHGLDSLADATIDQPAQTAPADNLEAQAPDQGTESNIPDQAEVSVQATEEPIKEGPVVSEEAPSPLATAEEPTVAQEGPALDQNIIIDVLELKDMDIGDVLKLISKKSGLNIVAGQEVKGKVTIYLKNVDVRDVLRIILESNDLAYAEEKGIIRVMGAKDYELTYGHRFGEKTQVSIVQLKYANAADVLALLTQMKSNIGKVIADDKSNTVVLMETPDKLQAMGLFLKEIDVPIATKVFELSYSQAEDISKKVSEALTKNVGTIKFDKRSNKIIVTDTPQKLSEIEEMIKAFDEKHEEVLIEAKIVQIILSDQYKLGVDWESIVQDFHSLNLKNNFDILSSTDKSGKLSIGTLSSDDYTVLLEALDAVGTTNVLSSPHITAVNNEEAKILVGSTEPYVTTTTTTPASGPTTTAESVNFIDVGVKLYVTPMIHKDRNITMKIKPEVSSVTSFVTTSNNNKIPVVETSQAETKVMVKDNVTIVIGGLIKDEKVESINKIPFLGDLPLFGFAFRNKDNLIKKTELVIFLTPKIITGDIPAERTPSDILSEKLRR